jgi:hypothetical protein
LFFYIAYNGWEKNLKKLDVLKKFLDKIKTAYSANLKSAASRRANKLCLVSIQISVLIGIFFSFEWLERSDKLKKQLRIEVQRYTTAQV